MRVFIGQSRIVLRLIIPLIVTLVIIAPVYAEAFTFTGNVNINGVSHTVNITETGPTQVALTTSGWAAGNVYGPGGSMFSPGFFYNEEAGTTTGTLNITTPGNYTFYFNGGGYGFISYTLVIQTNTGVADTTPPNTQILTNPPAAANTTSADFTFTGTDNTTSSIFLSYQCRLDNTSPSAWTTCNSPRSLAGLSQGNHTFEVRAVDQAGNVDPTPAAYTWTVDSCIVGSTTLHYTGMLSGPQVDYNLCFRNIGETTVTIFGSGSGSLTYYLPYWGTPFTYNFSTTPYVLEVTAAAGQPFKLTVAGTPGITYDLTINYMADTTPPETVITNAPSGIVNGTSTTVNFTGTDNQLGNGLTFRCQLNGGAWTSCGSPRTVTGITGLQTFSVYATDFAGNADPTPATATWRFCDAIPNPVTTTAELVLAVTAANCNPANDIINLQARTYTFSTINNGSNALPLIGDAATSGMLTINGNNAIIERASGASDFRFLEAFADTVLTINNLTMRNGSLPSGQGGAIRSIGTLNLTNVTLTSNTALIGGALYTTPSTGIGIPRTLNIQRSNFNNNSADSGGAIYSRGSMNIVNTTIDNNTANVGGGIYRLASVDTYLYSSTVSNNDATQGGGVFIQSSSPLVGLFQNNTFYGNTAVTLGGAIRSEVGGLSIYNNTFTANSAGTSVGGVYMPESTDLRNNILAGNTAPANPDLQLYADPMLYNLIGSTAGLTYNPAEGQGNIVDALASPLNFGPLANNGGLTATVALLAGSVAIDTGDTILTTPPATDQRGIARVLGSRMDIGAFESSLTASPLISISAATTTIPEGTTEYFALFRLGNTTAPLNVTLDISLGSGTTSGDFTVASPNLVSQSGTNVVFNVPAGSMGINFEITAVNDGIAEPDNTFTLMTVDGVDYDLGSPNSVTFTIPVNNVGVNSLSDTGEGSLRQALENAMLFDGAEDIIIPAGQIDTASPLVIGSDVTLSGAGATTIVRGNGSHQVFTINGGTVLLRGFAIQNGNATTGGGVGVYGGTVTIGNDPIFLIGNSATTCGGGLYVGTGATTIVQAGSQITGNTTTANGGGICVEGGALSVLGPDTLVNDNTATGNGGGIYVNGGSANVQSAASISGNDAAAGGGVYQAAGSVTIADSFIQQNTGTASDGAIRFASSDTRSVTNSCIVANSDTAVTYVGGSGVIATSNWWGSEFGPFSNASMPTPPNDEGTAVSNGDSVTLSSDPAVFDYSNYLFEPPSPACLVCEAASSTGGARVCDVN